MQQTRPRLNSSLPPPRAGEAEARRLRHDLRHSMREGAFTLCWQTRRRLRDHARLGAEAQVRWPCRGRGVVQASAFAAVLDECGLGAQLLAWTITAACRRAGTWAQGVVSVGVPAAAARDGSLLPLIGHALAETGLDPERLEISLQDGDLAGDCPDTLLTLSTLRDLGAGVALEAFGRTGACLIKLSRLPLTAIKLDCSLVRDLPQNGAAAAMVSSIAGFAHALGIEVAAAMEGAEQRQILAQLGCDAGIEREVDVFG